MRQAGRYLPEYRAIRSKHSFMEMCKIPEVAAEVTIQPVDLIGVDAAILFSDIMLPLEGMGAGLEFTESAGPIIKNPIRELNQVEDMHTFDVEDVMSYAFDAIKLIVKELGGRVPLIGFAGAPFTLASYLIEGGHSRNYTKTKIMMYNEPVVWHRLMTKLTDMLIGYLGAQVRAGVAAVQVFDSWIGCLSPGDYEEFAMPHSKRLFEGLKPLDVPTIHFGTETSTLIEKIRDAGGDVVGVDWRLNIDEGRRRIGYDRAVQGNLDPNVLFSNTKVIESHVRDILNRAGTHPGHIFNLGHGILPETPPANARALVEMVHELSAKGCAT